VGDWREEGGLDAGVEAHEEVAATKYSFLAPPLFTLKLPLPRALIGVLVVVKKLGVVGVSLFREWRQVASSTVPLHLSSTSTVESTR